MADLLHTVRQAIRREGLLAPGDRVVVGVSGGVDSLVLLHVLRALSGEAGIALHVATLDHGLRGAAGAADAAAVRDQAAAWGLPVTVGRAEVPAAAAQSRLSVEEAARQVRYTFLSTVARQVGASKIAVGHQQDDQAETVLMHLIRGSGLDGLRGMLPLAPLDEFRLLPGAALRCDPPLPDDPPAPAGPIWVIRPLLDTPRAAILDYAAAHDLRPRHDASNDDLTFFRNRLRHEVLPLLETLNPALRATLARTAAVLRADADLLDRAGEDMLARLLRRDVPGALILDREAWAGLAPGEQRRVIRAVVRRLRPDLRDLALEHVEFARGVAARGGEATLPGGLRLRAGGRDLIVQRGEVDESALLPGDAPALLVGQGGSPFLPGEVTRRVFGAWTFTCRPLRPDDDRAALHADPLAAILRVPAGAWLRLRGRQRGDRLRPRGMGGHSQKLSDTFVNLRVPAGWRDRVPLLTVDGEIAWLVAPAAAGVRGRVGEPFAVPEGPLPAGWAEIVVRWAKERVSKG